MHQSMTDFIKGASRELLPGKSQLFHIQAVKPEYIGIGRILCTTASLAWFQSI
jgi:hypothetical protein